MIFAVVLVYALMVVNFQSWLDPFIIITALPGAIAGVLWALSSRRRRSTFPPHGGHHVDRAWRRRTASWW